MKTKLPAFAAAFLLAVPTAPAFADDLLDAVLWDGPSAFPSRAAPSPAPEPPPPPVPEPEPAPAPVYPSRSSYTFRSPAPAPAPLPAAPLPAAPEPAASAPIPAASDPVSFSGETQLRREIQEMRARADRLEAALAPAPSGASSTTASTTATPAIIVPSWTLSVRGGVGSEDSIFGHAELVKRLGDSPFDLVLRGAVLAQTETRSSYYEETYYTYTYSWRRGLTSHKHTRKIHYDYDVDERNILGDFHLVLRPLRESHFSPYAGVGGRYEYLHFEGDRGGQGNEGDFSLSGRVGLVLYVPHFERLALKGEFIGGSESTELVGEASLRLGGHFVLAAFVDHYDIDFGRATAFGGGFSLLF